MNTSDIVLTVVDHNGGEFVGNTLLQKTVFFLNELSDLNISFNPHYYGPYSSELSATIENLVALKFLDVIKESFPVWNVWGEVKRYTYKLTDDGREILKDIKRNPQYKKIVKKLDLIGTFSESKDYDKLSKAAKIYHIVKAKGKATKRQINKEATTLGWSLKEAEIEPLTSFLQQLKLVR